MSKRYFLLGLLLLLLFPLGLTACNRPDPMSSMNQEMVMNNAISNDYNWQISATPSLQAGKPITLTWTVKEKGTGLPVRAFEKTHERLSHLILVNRDLSIFQHIHPELTGPGQMAVKTQLPREDEYIVFLQFATPDKGEVTLRQPLRVGTAAPSVARLVPDANKPKSMDGYTVRVTDYPTTVNEAAMPTFSLEKDGQPVTEIQPYLGAGGHGVILSEDTESFLHVHPMTSPNPQGLYVSPITFHTIIQKPGLYRMWGQFQIAGKVETVDFTFEVK